MPGWSLFKTKWKIKYNSKRIKNKISNSVWMSYNKSGAFRKLTWWRDRQIDNKVEKIRQEITDFLSKLARRWSF